MNLEDIDNIKNEERLAKLMKEGEDQPGKKKHDEEAEKEHTDNW